jgi:dTDP-4-amino-4,6-dideoxygalactose transaminase
MSAGVAPPITRHIGVGTWRASDRAYELIRQVLDSGRISYGPLSLEFEQRFAALHDCQYAILSNSGTSSLQVALQAMAEARGWGAGGQVIVPATTFVATANIVIHNRMRPVFVDVDQATYNINPELIERAITPWTRAIIPVNLFGQPANLAAVRAIADRHGLAVIEDSCETMFVTHHNRPVGSWGDIGCFSTYVAHLLVTGVGGLATTNDPDLAARMRSLVNHGLTLDCLNPGANFSPQAAPGRRFRFGSTGHSYRITEMEAALGLAQLNDVPQMLAARRRNARHLAQGLANINAHYADTFQLPVTAPGNEHAFMMFPIVLRRGDKESLMAHLNAHGIETRDMLPILGQPVFKYLTAADYPVSANIVQNGFYVGCHQDLTPEDIRFMVGVFGLWAHPEYPGILPE